MVKGKHDATLVDRKPKPIPNPMDPLTRQLAVVDVINEKLDRVIKILKERKGDLAEQAAAGAGTALRPAAE